MYRHAVLPKYSIILVLLVSSSVVAFGLCAAAAGQTEEHSHSHVGWIPQELLERPVPLRTGIGSIHEQVSTSSREAQEFYDQGLAYLQSYVWIEAARSFHQALRYDPKLAMAYVGLSYAYSPIDFPAARTALEHSKTLALSESLPDREQRRIKIRELQLRAMTDTSKVERELAFRDALDDAIAAYPEDVIFLLLRGVAQEPSPFADGQECQGGGAQFFERALAIDPENFAAHHFLTHCYENSGRVADAVPHALEYARLAPDVPHAQHMCGHVLRRADRMDEAIARFGKADELERAYFAREKISPSLDWHYAHNLNLLASSYQYVGKIGDAEKYFRAAAALPAYTDYDSFNRKDWPEFLLDRGRYPEALAAARQMTQKPSPLARTAGHALAGDVFLATGRPKEAVAELTQADEIVKTLNPSDVPTVRPYTDGLRAALLLRAGQKAQAEAIFETVERRISAANGPDNWTQGLFHLEFLCGVARRENDWDLAGELANVMYQRAPDYAGSHYAMALVAQHNGSSETAAREFSAAVTFWSEADPDLSELGHAHRELAKLAPQEAKPARQP